MKSNFQLLLFTCILWGSSQILYAQSGLLDTTFNPGSGADIAITTSSILDNGKIIIGGGFTLYNGIARNNIARINPDGSLDTTFNPGTGSNHSVACISIQSDGKIIIGGGFTFYNETVRNHIARINADGSLDTTFNPGTGLNLAVNTSSIQNDGKIIIGGDFNSYNGTARNNIARINPDGSLDTTFIPGTGFNSSVNTVYIQNDGKILIGGNFNTFNGTAINHIVRLNNDGSLDVTFNSGIGANNAVRTISVQNDGKILIGGLFTSYNGTARNRIARINTDGSLDPAFNPGTGASSYVYSTSIQSDGKILIGGLFTSYNGTVRNRIARINIDGSLDTSFNSGSGSNGGVCNISIQSNEKIVIVGAFNLYNGINRSCIARILNSTETSTAETLAKPTVSLFPNPASKLITIELSTQSPQPVEIINLVGQTVLTMIIDHLSSVIDVSAFPPGVYIVTVGKQKQAHRLKMIKQ